MEAHGGRAARLVEVDGNLLAESDTVVTDETVLGLIDSDRRRALLRRGRTKAFHVRNEGGGS
jgi:hypothetical protein